jgi:hypothetical protein
MKWLQTCNDENLENNEEKHLLGVWISQRTLSLCVSILIWWVLIKTLLNRCQSGIPVQASWEGRNHVSCTLVF